MQKKTQNQIIVANNNERKGEKCATHGVEDIKTPN